MVSDITTLKVRKRTHSLLLSRGKKGESFDDIINKLLKSKRRLI